jgi:hypothetical protein
MHRNALLSLSLLALSAPLFAGCAARHTGQPNDDVSGGTDTSETESNVEALSTTFVGGSTSGTATLSFDLGASGGVHLNSLGDAAKAYFLPAGCLTVTDDPSTSQATYTFAGCTGPHGLVHVTGVVTVGYAAPAANELQLSYSATGLQINGATLDWTASAVVTANGAARDMVWDGAFTGTTARGRAIHRTNHKDYTWTVGGSCLGVNGSSDGNVSGRELKIDIIGYDRCTGACPQSGSEIKVTDVSTGAVYDLTYGNDTATYTDPQGHSTEFTPLCAL